MMVRRGDSGINDFMRNDLEKIILRFTLRTLLNSMTYLYLTAVQKPAMFCSQLSAGRTFTRA